MSEFDATQVVRKKRGERAQRQSELEARKAADRELFSDEDGNPTLRPSFVLYLDELGTKARLEGMTTDGLREDIQAYDQLRWFLNDETHGWDSEFQRTLYFSDNVAVVLPIQPRTTLDDLGLFHQVLSAAAYQLNLAVRQRFLRGGLCVGDAYADSSFVTGPAHIAAVLLEENDADVPRVLLDDVSIALAEHEASFYSAPEQSPYYTFLLRDHDQRVFINYLAAAAEDEDSVPGITVEGLTRHKTAVEAALTASASIPKVHAKYEWAAAYHNYVTRSICGQESLAIPGLPDVRFKRFTPPAPPKERS